MTLAREHILRFDIGAVVGRLQTQTPPGLCLGFGFIGFRVWGLGFRA